MNTEETFDDKFEKILIEGIKRSERKRHRRGVVGAILGGALGTILTLSGFDVTTWQFWVILALSLGQIVNTGW